MTKPSLSEERVQSHLLIITKEFLTELDRHKSAEKFTMTSDLTREGGIDSLGRVELFHRFEQKFGVLLSQDLMVQGRCLNDFVSAIIDAKPQNLDVPKTTPISRVDAIADHQLPTLTGGFLHLSEKHPEQIQTYLHVDGDIEPLSYANLRENAEKVCAYLQSEGIMPNDTVAIMLPTGKEFFYTFLGIQLAGAVPVPIYPPLRPEMIEEYALREAKILENAGVRILITFNRAKKLSNMLGILINSLKKVVNVSALLQFNGVAKIIAVTPSAPGLIQYTSGSTSLPKGVLLSHGNLVANIHAIKETIKMTHHDLGVSWLPLYHDMGLIGSWLNSMYHGIPIVIMSPLDFLVRPESWLWAIHNFRGTLSAAPNFAYELCIKKIPEERLQGLDLSSWRLAFNGAEAVRAQTLRDFYVKFRQYGLSETAQCPVYGLAENSVSLTVPELDKPFTTDCISKADFEQKRLATKADKRTPHHEFVNCGKVIAHHGMRVVNDKGESLEDRIIGHLQFTGPSQMQCYYNNIEATQQCVTKDGWIDSGDLAYLVEGDVYIVGRKKDIIIKAGRNFYPEEIEDIVSHINGVRKGCIVAFGVQEAHLGTEQMVIVAESRITQNAHKKLIASEILSKVTIALGVAPDDIVIVAPKSVPKTSSGKLQRAKCKQWYVEGKLGKKRLPIVAQLGKIWFKTATVRLNKGLRWLIQFPYTLLCNFSIVLSAVVLMLSSLMLPRRYNRQFAKIWVKCIFKLIMCKIEYFVPKNCPQGIIISNHQSYLDAAVLLSVLPVNTTFVGKKSLSKIPVLNFILKRLGVVLVERNDVEESLKDFERLYQSSAKNNDSIAIFPEGTFTEKHGILPFKMGAFEMAAKLDKSIVPVVISGTRNVLRAYKWLMWPGAIKVSVLEPIKVSTNTWDDMLIANKHARQMMADALNEPLIDS